MPSVARCWVEPLLHQLDGVHQLGEPLERVVLALERDQHRVRRGERIEREQAERRRAVDDDVVVLLAAGAERLAEPELAALLVDQLDLGAGEVRRGGDHLEVPELGGVDQLGHGPVVEQGLVDGARAGRRA